MPVPERLPRTTNNKGSATGASAVSWGHRETPPHGIHSQVRASPALQCGGYFTQDPDTLDTWFSPPVALQHSGLKRQRDLKYFYPTNTPSFH